MRADLVDQQLVERGEAAGERHRVAPARVEQARELQFRDRSRVGVRAERDRREHGEAERMRFGELAERLVGGAALAAAEACGQSGEFAPLEELIGRPGQVALEQLIGRRGTFFDAPAELEDRALDLGELAFDLAIELGFIGGDLERCPGIATWNDAGNGCVRRRKLWPRPSRRRCDARAARGWR